MIKIPPPSLPPERAKVAKFYSARSKTIPPLPWQTFALPFSRQNDDPNLRSMAEVSGYHIHATDGEIGHLSDVLIEDSDWTLRYLIVNTSNWWQGKEVLISPRSTESIRWTEHLIYLGVNRDRVRTSPEYDASRPISTAFDTKMASHYGPTKPADAA